MNLKFALPWQNNMTIENEDYEHLITIKPDINEFELWVIQQMDNCYIAFDEFDIWS